MRTPSRTLAGAAALTAAALVLAMGPGGVAASGEQGRGTGEPGTFPGDSLEVKERDSRKGRVAPSARQLAAVKEAGARARWNDFGTPAVLTSTGRPLAEGLPAEPVAAAKAYVAANRDLLGLTERAPPHWRSSVSPRSARAPPCCSGSGSAAWWPAVTGCSLSESATAPSGT